VRFPGHGWAGVVMIVLFWALNWVLEGPRTHLYFFPLWLGYALAVDGLVLIRRGTSLLTRSRRDFALLFVMSAPAWWLFELINRHTQNWTYVGAELFTDVQYVVLCTIAFSTVMPAVFETAELIRSFRWTDRASRGPYVSSPRRAASWCFAMGIAAAALIWLWPTRFYPLVWGMLVGLIEPLNVWIGRRSLLDEISHGDWGPAVCVATGALTCGFFWELWNTYSFPKWTYHTPGVDVLYVFEMPLLGYVGYLPFGLELYALARLVRGRGLNLSL
jgi:hypothetical protein